MTELDMTEMFGAFKEILDAFDVLKDEVQCTVKTNTLNRFHRDAIFDGNGFRVGCDYYYGLACGLVEEYIITDHRWKINKLKVLLAEVKEELDIHLNFDCCTAETEDLLNRIEKELK